VQTLNNHALLKVHKHLTGLTNRVNKSHRYKSVITKEPIVLFLPSDIRHSDFFRFRTSSETSKHLEVLHGRATHPSQGFYLERLTKWQHDAEIRVITTWSIIRKRDPYDRAALYRDFSMAGYLLVLLSLILFSDLFDTKLIMKELVI
jgi:hypothetical protein